MSTLLCADFILAKDGQTIYAGYSEHCCFVDAGSLKGHFESDEFILLDGDQEIIVSNFFSFSLESVDPAEIGSIIQLLTSSNIGCLISYNGWWDIYVPVQYLDSMSNISGI